MELTLNPIALIRSPYRKRGEAPHQGKFSQEVVELEIFPEFEAGLKDIETCSHLIVLYWLDQAKRDVLITTTPHDAEPHGVFATRSPNRPNPIAFQVVKLLERKLNRLKVIGLDAFDGTPLLDLKPYSAELDSVPEAQIGWFEKAKRKKGGER